METNTPERQEPILPDRHPHLSPIEHFIIASTPTLRGKTVDVRSLITQAKRGDSEAYNTLLTPVLIQTKGNEVQAEVVEVRSRERLERRNRGGLLIDIAAQVALAKEGMEVSIEWSDVDPEKNTVVPSWKVFVLKRDRVVEDPSILERVKLHGDPEDPFSPGKLFDLQRVKGEPYFIASLNLSKS